MRYIALIVVVLALAACGGGSSSTTLRGTFTDDADVANASAPCSSEELGGAITVAVDNVPAGRATSTGRATRAA
jgi:ABC-type glycerol-3-phosphate transport system substrate-binding protein